MGCNRVIEPDDKRVLSREWLQVGDHLVDLFTEYFFKLFLQDVLSRSEERLVHLFELRTPFLGLREPLLRRNLRRSGLVHLDQILTEPNLEVRIARVQELLWKFSTANITAYSISALFRVLGIGHLPQAGWLRQPCDLSQLEVRD